jgi:hypothetical protein
MCRISCQDKFPLALLPVLAPQAPCLASISVASLIIGYSHAEIMFNDTPSFRSEMPRFLYHV